MILKIYKGKKKLSIQNVKECSELEKVIGLMFTSVSQAKPLLFKFKKPTNLAIHSYFVFFPFTAIWLDSKNKVQEIQIIQPFTLRIRPKKPFFNLLELPNTKKYRRIIE